MATNITATEADFNDIKASLKQFLESQSEFQDYNFDGSGLSILLELLAFNTHYSAFYANMLANEMFLDSASIRDSVVSHAKHIDFVPTSKTSSRATLDITFSPTNSPSSIELANGTKWTTSIDNKSYTFQTIAPITVTPVNGLYNALNVDIYEGTALKKEFTVDSTDLNQRFILPNKNVDTSHIIITIQNSSSDSTTRVFTQATSIKDIKETDNVFWIQEVEDEKHELIFGDGVIGTKLDDGNIIRIDYLVTNGPLANGASTFSSVSAVGGLPSSQVTWNVVSESAGGADIQSIDDIKFLAPKLYQTQGRGVTAEDYKNILLQKRPDIESIAVWGGEDNVPQKFGKVFIAIKPKHTETYSETTKQQIELEILKDLNVVSITPEIVDADFTYVKITTSFNYDINLLDVDIVDVEQTVRTNVQNYFTDTLNKFENKFRFSLLSGIIDDSHNAIKNNNTTYLMEKRIKPLLNTLQSFTVEFNNPIEVSSLVSTEFTIGGLDYSFDDDGLGKVRIFRTVNQIKEFLTTDTGSIDYATGEIKINSLSVSAIVDGTKEIDITITPVNNDIEAKRAQIITMDTSDPKSLTITSSKD